MTRITRRGALAAAGAGLGASVLPTAGRELGSVLEREIREMPNVSGHEHWGSIDAAGWSKAGYIADLVAGVEPRDASFLDVLFDPYSGMGLGAMGLDRNGEAKANGYENLKDWWRKDPVKAWKSIRKTLTDLRSTGWYACLAEGFRTLYDAPFSAYIDDENTTVDKLVFLDNVVQNNYQNLMAWYEQAYRITGIEYILRPTQLEFGFRQENPKERELMAPLLRIDQFCSFYWNRTSAMEFCVEKTGVDPKNADEFREFLSKCFDLADQAGFKGTKQLQAYTRPLDFTRPNDSEVSFEAVSDRDKQLVFGNFVMYECAELAAKRGWPHQIHTGTHNLPDSNPLPLRTLVKAFPQVEFVLIHCWPFLEESAFLAKSYPNVSIDTCWTPVLNLEYFKQSLETYIGYLPDTKVTIGHDSTSVEMAAGSLSYCRSILARVLREKVETRVMTREAALSLAEKYLAGNARRIYGMG